MVFNFFGNGLGNSCLFLRASTFENLKSRIVAFREVDDSLYMLEATQGHSITKDIPQVIVLARFPIEKVTSDVIFFDFVAGMEKIFVSSDWHGHDFEGPDYDQHQWNSIALDLGLLEKVEVDKNLK